MKTAPDGTAEPIAIPSDSFKPGLPILNGDTFTPSSNSDSLSSRDYTSNNSLHDLDALIVGASWAGIHILHRLRTLGLSVQLVDACADVGGVWHYTRYPGCRVDTEIPYYEFSDPALWEKWRWTQRFPAREEVQRYLGWVCDELGLRGSMVQGVRVQGCQWDEIVGKWKIMGSGGFEATAQFLLPCSGYSTVRYIPDLPGLENFEIKFHTSQWPEDLDLRGKRVAVIGTAASGLQVIESLAKTCGHLTVFQRTPNLATPMRQETYSEAEMVGLKKEFPAKFAGRRSTFGFDGGVGRRMSEDSPAQREEVLEGLWQRGGLAFWLGNYSDMLTDAAANAHVYDFWRRKVRQRIHDPIKADVLAPVQRPHPFGTKRPSLETAYFDLFNQPNTTLINLPTDLITAITPTGLTTASGTHHAVDLLILATGFDFLTASLLAINITGLHDRRLADVWRLEPESRGVATFLGLMTNDFPNLLFPMGPQAPSALGLTPQMAEVQGDWVARLVAWVRERRWGVVEPTVGAQEAWKREVLRAAGETLFAVTESWYMGANIPGRKKQPLCYFGGIDKYINKLEECAAQGSPGLRFS